MPARTVADQADTLLDRKVVRAREGGAQTPDLESISLFESIAVNFLLRPKTALYTAHLARNGLVSSAATLLDAIDELKTVIKDLSNISVQVQSNGTLERARTALLQIEGLDKVSSDNHLFQRFSNAVDEFLNKELAKNVRRSGKTNLTRPGEEARIDLGTSYTALLEDYSDFLVRLYALSVGIENFEAAPFGTLMGLDTAAQVRADLESMIEELDGSASNSRDMAIRLITGRAALRSMGSPVELYKPVLSTSEELPEGYALSAISDPAPASIDTTTGPWTLAAGAQIAITQGTTLGPFSFPQTTFDLGNKTALLGSVVSFPVTVPDLSYLFVKITLADGSVVSKRITLNVSGAPISMSLASVLAALNTGLGADGAAVEFCKPGTNRILIYATSASATAIALTPTHTEIDSVTLLPRLFTNSVHTLFGLTLVGAGPGTSVVVAREAFKVLFSGLVTVKDLQNGKLRIETIASTPGVLMTITAPTALGIAGTHLPVSDQLQLYGKVNGVETSDVSPIDLVDVGDEIATPSGTVKIAKLGATRITLSAALRTFDGPVTVTSALDKAYVAINAALQPFVDSWLASDFGVSLKKLDAPISVLMGMASPAQQNEATAVLDDLRSRVADLSQRLSAAETLLDSSAASKEKVSFNGILNSLEERGYDKAVVFLLRCQLQELLQLDHDAASYGGTLMKTMADVGQSDLQFPNRMQDEEDPIRGADV